MGCWARPLCVGPVFPTLGHRPWACGAHSVQATDGTIAAYKWSWGDGTPEQSTTSPTIVHAFADTTVRCVHVTYAVLSTVVDDKGQSGSASQQVKVTEVPVAGSTGCR